VRRAYAEFLEVNQPLLDLCTRWQLRTVGGAEELNDHRDADYDRTVLDALGPIDEVAVGVCAELTSALRRFGGYGARLAAARRAVDDGDVDALCGAGGASYHSVWFELHENLLATLGLERGQDPLVASPLEEAR
jgi:hypothetical protein